MDHVTDRRPSHRSLFCLIILLATVFSCERSGIIPASAAGYAVVSTSGTNETAPSPRAVPASASIPNFRCRVVAVYPHDPAAFTQGLFFHDGHLYEGTGLHGHSAIRKIELTTGRILMSKLLPNQYFGEGITLLGKKIFQLTWLSRQGFIYDLTTFTLEKTFSYPTVGWGLTNDGTSLIMSDGSPRLYYLDPRTFERERTIEVKEGTAFINNLNELEYIDGEIFANIWQSERIARISPINGAIAGWIDCRGLLDTKDRGQADVLNGIAWDNAGKRLFLTGKRWPKLFHVELVPLVPDQVSSGTVKH